MHTTRRSTIGAAVLATILASLPLGLPAMAQDGPRTAQLTTRPIVIDTDLGADDVMALAWLVNEATLDIRAITVTGTGLASCATGVGNLRTLLLAMDASGPEVGCGSDVPVADGTPFPADWGAGADALHGLALPPAPDAAAPWRPAEDILRSILDESTDPVTILSLGPLTTLARVFDDPDRAFQVASVTAMLGAIGVSGNVVADGATTPGAAEWNAHADPGAVDAVLGAGVPLTVVPLDATNQVPMSQTLIEGLSAGGEAPTARLIAQLFAANPWMAQPEFFPWDPLAAVSLTHRDVIDTRERLLAVARDGPDAGAISEAADGLPAQVAIGADRTAFELAYLAGVRGEDGSTPATPSGVLTIRGGSGECTLDTGGTSTPGLAILDVQATDEAMIMALAGLSEGYGIADLEGFLTTTSPTQDPPEWLLLAAYVEVEAGASVDDTAELTPGGYAVMCITADEATPRYLVAPTLLTITE